ncbi:hypothetical protein [Gallaecimonas sp. GXIMD4217]|uniref:hypothetical protein n=1 Tax=Gallaecimonas sp. GXIMD4217 TaxID=3131927 RepID=UPI00311AF7C2
MDRRAFLKLSLGTSAALALLGCSPRLPDGAWTAEQRALWRAWIPAVLSHYRHDPELVLAKLEAKLLALPKRERRQLSQLLDLLASPWLVGPLCGLWRPWPDAGIQERSQALDGLRRHWLRPARQAYNALVQLITLAAFTAPALQQQLGYPGPLFPEQLITRPNDYS